MKKLLLSFVLAAFATSSMALGWGNDNPPSSGGTSINTNTNGNNNTNLNTASAMQGQIQGQFQGQSTSVDVSNRISNESRASALSSSLATGGAGGAGGAGGQGGAGGLGGSAVAAGGLGGSAVAAGGLGGTSNATASSGGNTQSVSGNTQNVTVTDSGKINYTGSYEVKNVPSVFSGNVYPTAPCMGSTTVGGSGVGFGISLGHTWKDDDCGIRETARSFASMQMPDDAITVLCTSEYAKTAPSCVAKAAKKAENE